jgi:hypothetical protein
MRTCGLFGFWLSTWSGFDVVTWFVLWLEEQESAKGKRGLNTEQKINSTGKLPALWTSLLNCCAGFAGDKQSHDTLEGP